MPKLEYFPPDFPYQSFIRNTVLDRDFVLKPNVSINEALESLRTQQREANDLYQAQFEVCERVMGEELRYFTTSTVARDIEFIVIHLDGNDAPMYLPFSVSRKWSPSLTPCVSETSLAAGMVQSWANT